MEGGFLIVLIISVCHDKNEDTCKNFSKSPFEKSLNG